MRYLEKTAWVVSVMLALCFLKPCAVSASDSIIVPIGASASTFHSAPYGPQWMIDGSGLTGTGRAATHTNANATNLFWHSNETDASGRRPYR